MIDKLKPQTIGKIIGVFIFMMIPVFFLSGIVQSKEARVKELHQCIEVAQEEYQRTSDLLEGTRGEITEVEKELKKLKDREAAQMKHLTKLNGTANSCRDELETYDVSFDSHLE